MNEISVTNSELPGTVEELTKYVLIGRERVKAVKLAIKAIDRIGVAEEVYQQKLAEGQDIAEVVLDAQSRLGELRKSLQRDAGGRPEKTGNNDVTSLQQFDAAISPNAKEESQKVIGRRLQQIAEHPDIVERVKAEAREKGEIVTASDVLSAIQQDKKPHVSFNSGNNEWYTPSDIIEAARRTMGSIDLDPASSEIANKTVKASEFYTIEDDGLSKKWFGNVFMNPPYSSDLIMKFCEKVVSEDISQAIILVNNATETSWFRTLIKKASAIVFHYGRIKYRTSDDSVSGAPLQGQAILYIGKRPDNFINEFKGIGWGAYVCRTEE